MFSKTLNFSYENLGQEGYLIFTFDDEQISGHQMYEDYFPVVWRVVHLQESGLQQFSETYEQQFMFATSQIQQGKVTTGSAITQIDFKESTDLTGDDDNGYDWSAPTKFENHKNTFEAHNKTPKAQGISVCRQKSSTRKVPEPLLFFNNVGAGATLKIKFKGQLRIYAATNMQSGTVIDAEVTSPKLWDHPIDEPGLEEDWVITYNRETGDYEINPAPKE